MGAFLRLVNWCRRSHFAEWLFEMVRSLPVVLLLSWLTIPVPPGLALPPPDEIPEEVLRTEILVEGRSPIDGELLTPAEYAELQAQLEAGPPLEPEISPRVRNLIGLLRLRKFIKTVFPFIPIR